MRCKEVMTRNPICCTPRDTAAQVARVMKAEDVGSIPICEDRLRYQLVGIVTDRDLALKVVADGRDPKNTKVANIMTLKPMTCFTEDDLQEALYEMENKQVRRIPIVNGDGMLVGIISQADIANRCEEPEKIAEVVEVISRPRMRAA